MSLDKLPPKAQQYLKQIDDLQKTYASIASQRQQLQLTLMEYRNASEALKEVPDDGDVYKLVGNIFFKTNKKKVWDELQENMQILEARIKALETQEKKIRDELERLRNEVNKLLSSMRSSG